MDVEVQEGKTTDQCRRVKQAEVRACDTSMYKGEIREKEIEGGGWGGRGRPQTPSERETIVGDKVC